MQSSEIGFCQAFIDCQAFTIFQFVKELVLNHPKMKKVA